MKVNLGLKWFIGTGASWLISLDDTLRTVGLALGLVVTVLTIANLSWELYRKFSKKK
jgi:hypothetical protein